MERLSIKPRGDWQQQVESLGLSFHTQKNGEIYWNESTCYRFKPQEIEELKAATDEVEKMCIAVVDHVVQYQRYGELNIPEEAWHLIESSWQRREKTLYGRLDFSYDGKQPPKLLEYNADTPMTLPECSIIQRQWLEQVRPNAGQFNSIHEGLIATWPQFGRGLIHLACLKDHMDEYAHIAYMADTITAAGMDAKLMTIEQILWDGQNFYDTERTEIKTLFKLEPWEWLFDDVYRHHAHQTTMQIIEPIWKMILSNKGLLVLLWELFPNHPNLLPAFFHQKHFTENYVKKPLFGREGQNISLFSDNAQITTDGPCANGPFMYQQSHCLPNFDGHYPLIGSWLIAGEPAGIGIREDKTPITKYLSQFVPHFFD
jgi:glutathionylspermidine synthase